MSKGVSEFTKQSVSGYPCGSIFKADLLFLCVLRFTWHLSRFEYNIHKIYTLCTLLSRQASRKCVFIYFSSVFFLAHLCS